MVSDPQHQGGVLRRALQRLLVGISWFSVFHPRSVLIVSLLLTVLGGWWATGLKLSTDVGDLLPRGLPAAERLRSLMQHFGGAEPLVIAISGRGEDDLEQRLDLAIDIRERLRGNKNFKGALGVFGEDPWGFLEGPQAEALLLYLSPEEIEALAPKLSETGIQAQVASNRDRLGSPLGPQLARLIREDPLSFSPPLMGRLSELRGRLKISVRDGMLVSGDETFVLLLLRPNGPSQDIAFATQLLSETAAAAKVALTANDLQGSVAAGPPPNGLEAKQLHIGITGAPAILADYRSFLASDLKWVSLISFVANLALYLVAFRRVSALLVAGTALWVGLTWSLGFTALAVGGINIFTAGSVAILCGLAIDPTIHLYNRYLEEVHAGKDMAKAFAIALGDTGIGILAVATTTSMAFLAAAVSSFRGIRELGIICAAGMLLSLAASLFLVPSITALIARVTRTAEKPRGLSGFGLEPLLRFVLRRPKFVIWVWVVGSVLLLLPTLGLRLDEDFSRFRPESAPSIKLQNLIADHTGTALQPILALVPGNSEQEILENSSKVESALHALTHGDQPLLMTVLGPSRVIPPVSQQQRSLEALRGLRQRGLDPASVESSLLAAEDRSGFAVDEVARRAALRVRRMLERDQPIDLAEARRGPLSGMLHEMMIEEAPGHTSGIVSAYLRPGVKTGEIVPAMRAAIASTGVAADLVGGRVISQDLKPVALRSGVIATLLCTGGVLIVLLLTFRSLKLALLTLLPLLIGVAGSIGLVQLFSIDFNLVSLSMLPLVIGMGIDNGIHVVHRFMEDASGDLEDVIHHTGRGLVMTAITTIAGFAALFFADNPGLRASAWLVCLGIGTSFVSAVTLLPALLVVTRKR
ncbi:MAG: MMPL family transporter [Acidobacteriota bacterium]